MPFHSFVTLYISNLFAYSQNFLHYDMKHADPDRRSNYVGETMAA